MTVIGESADQLNHQASDYKKEMKQLASNFSKLNPSAREFIPSSRSPGAKPNGGLSADAPSFDYHSNGNQDSGSDGSSNNLQNYRRRGNGNQVRRMNNRLATREEQIRRTVYVSDIDQHVTEKDLAALFRHSGRVVDCRICGDPHSILRFAFIEFKREYEAREALRLGGTMIGHYPLRVLPSKTAIVPVNPKLLPQTDDEKEKVGRTIYCTNIDIKVTQTEVQFFFEQYCGEVSRLRLLLDNKHSTCKAFVEFVKAESANIALSYSGVLLGSLPIRVSPSKTPVKPPLAARATIQSFGRGLIPNGNMFCIPNMIN